MVWTLSCFVGILFCSHLSPWSDVTVIIKQSDISADSPEEAARWGGGILYSTETVLFCIILFLLWYFGLHTGGSGVQLMVISLEAMPGDEANGDSSGDSSKFRHWSPPATPNHFWTLLHELNCSDHHRTTRREHSSCVRFTWTSCTEAEKCKAVYLQYVYWDKTGSTTPPYFSAPVQVNRDKTRSTTPPLCKIGARYSKRQTSRFAN